MLWVYLLIPLLVITYFLLRGIFYLYPVKKLDGIPVSWRKRYKLMWIIGFLLIAAMIAYIIVVLLRVSERMFWDDWILLPALTLIVIVVWNRLDFIFKQNDETTPPFFINETHKKL